MWDSSWDTDVSTTYLEHVRCGGRREVQALPQVNLWVVVTKVPIDHDGLRCALLTDQQNGLGLLGDGVNEELCANVVDIGDKDGTVLRGVVRRVVVLLNPLVPVFPFPCRQIISV